MLKMLNGMEVRRTRCNREKGTILVTLIDNETGKNRYVRYTLEYYKRNVRRYFIPKSDGE